MSDSGGIIDRLEHYAKRVMPRYPNDLCSDAKREIESLRAQLAQARNVEAIARAIYETEPHYESGEYVDGFQVSPGGDLSWEQALARDAEFATDPIMGSITAFAYRAARAVVSLSDEKG